MYSFITEYQQSILKNSNLITDSEHPLTCNISSHQLQPCAEETLSLVLALSYIHILQIPILPHHISQWPANHGPSSPSSLPPSTVHPAPNFPTEHTIHPTAHHHPVPSPPPKLLSSRTQQNTSRATASQAPLCPSDSTTPDISMHPQIYFLWERSR